MGLSLFNRQKNFSVTFGLTTPQPGYLCSVIEAPIYQFAATSYSIASKQSRLGNLTRDFCQDSNGSRDSSLIVEQLSPNGHISLKVPIVEFDFGYSFARYDKDSSF